jgi:hypothetical protein
VVTRAQWATRDSGGGFSAAGVRGATLRKPLMKREQEDRMSLKQMGPETVRSRVDGGTVALEFTVKSVMSASPSHEEKLKFEHRPLSHEPNPKLNRTPFSDAQAMGLVDDWIVPALVDAFLRNQVDMRDSSGQQQTEVHL